MSQPLRRTIVTPFVMRHVPVPAPGILQIRSDKRLYAPNGKQTSLRGIHEFNHCFFDNEGFRQSWPIRNSLYPASVADFSPPISSGVGQPCWLSLSYVSPAASRAKLALHKTFGFSSIRYWVDTGMIRTQPFTDPVTGLSFPTELEVNDDIVAACRENDMIAIMANANTSCPDADLATFWGIMGQRYRDRCDRVIFDLSNEPGSGDVYYDVLNPLATKPYSEVMPNEAAWRARMGAVLSAVRASGFQGVCLVGLLSNLWHIDTVIDSIENYTPFRNDPNLGVTIHPYYIWKDVATTFDSKRADFDTYVKAYADRVAIFTGELGLTNDYDFADPTRAAPLAYLKELLTYLQDGKFNGIDGFTTQPQHDHLNDIFNDDGSLTAWGEVLTDYMACNALRQQIMVPKISVSSGVLGDVSRSTISWQRSDSPLKAKGNFAIVIDDNGTASDGLSFLAPMTAPTPEQISTDVSDSNGRALVAKISGGSITITTPAGEYPGATGLTISGSFDYWAQP